MYLFLVSTLQQAISVTLSKNHTLKLGLLLKGLYYFHFMVHEHIIMVHLILTSCNILTLHVSSNSKTIQSVKIDPTLNGGQGRPLKQWCLLRKMTQLPNKAVHNDAPYLFCLTFLGSCRIWASGLGTQVNISSDQPDISTPNTATRW